MSEPEEAITEKEQTEDSHKSHDDEKDPTEDGHDASDDSSNDEDDIGEYDRYWPLPYTESHQLKGSSLSKTISAFAYNNAGTRFVNGGHDYEVRIWDFESIDKDRPASICNIQPCGQTIIKNLDFSKDDSLILVISESCQAVIIAKDGILMKQYQCPKGDQYISDMSNTKGHVQVLNDGCWNPKDMDNFITCSNDGTVRIWDLAKLTTHKTVIKTRSPASGLKAIPNVCKYSRDALTIVAGCNDGSVLMWDTRRKFISTSLCIKNAHLKGSEFTGVEFSYGLNKICTRNEDESCKLWDIRKLKDPLAVRGKLTTLYSATDCCFSPDDRFVLTGVSNTKTEPGLLLSLNVDNLETMGSIETPGTSVIRSRWHPKINHIGYSCSNGTINLTYDPNRSMGGFLSTSKGTKRKRYVSQREDRVKVDKIITPHSLPLFREDPSSTSFAKIRQDPKRSYKPVVPAVGLNQGGHVKPAGSTLSSFIAKNIAKPVDDHGMNIRERILRHAEEAEREPLWIKPNRNQPKTTQQSPHPQSLPPSNSADERSEGET